MTQRAERLLTVAEFEKMPESYERFELLDGVIVEKPLSGFRQGRIQRKLLLALNQFDPQEQLGAIAPEVHVFITEGYLPAPDLSFLVAGRVPSFNDNTTAPRPDLAVEIQSDGQSLSSLTGKVRRYLKAGISLAWIIQLTKKIALVYRGSYATPITIPASGKLDGGDVIPGFKIALSELFR